MSTNAKSAIVPPADQMVTDGAYGDYEISRIRISPDNRKRFNETALQELAASIKAMGIAQPILIRPVTPTDDAPEDFEIVAGERRYRASIIAGRTTIPAVCRKLSDLDAAKLRILENLQREDPHPIEEAEGYQQLMMKHGYTADQLAEEVNKSRSYIYGRLKFCALTTDVREQFLADKIPASTALLIARIPVPALQTRALDEILNPKSWPNEPLSYRKASEHIQRHYMLDLAIAIFSTTDAKLLANAGACSKCPKRTGNQPEVFADVASADVCTDPDCFDEKRAAHHAKTIVFANKKGLPVFEGDEGYKHLSNQFIHNSEFVTASAPLHAFPRNAPATKNAGAISSHLQGDAMPTPSAYVKENDGDVTPLYRRTDIQAALEKAGACETVSVHAERMKAVIATPDKKAQAKDNANKAAQDAYEKRVALATRATAFRVRLYKQFRERAANGLSLDSLREFVKFILVDDNGYALPNDLLDLYGLQSYGDKEVCKFIDAATLPTVQLVLLDIVMGESLSVGHYDVDNEGEIESSEAFDALHAMARHEGIDVDQVARHEKVRGLALADLDATQVHDFVDAFPERINELAQFILTNSTGSMVTAMELAAQDLGYQYRPMNEGGYVKRGDTQPQPAGAIEIPSDAGQAADFKPLADVMPEAIATAATKPSTKPAATKKAAAKPKAAVITPAAPAAVTKKAVLAPAAAWPFPKSGDAALKKPAA